MGRLGIQYRAVALGRNLEAARYSRYTDRPHGDLSIYYLRRYRRIGLDGALFVLDVNSVQPIGHRSFYELYAIATMIRVLYKAINVLSLQAAS